MPDVIDELQRWLVCLNVTVVGSKVLLTASLVDHM